MNAISFKLWQLICEMYIKSSYKFYIIPIAHSWFTKKIHNLLNFTLIVAVNDGD